MVGENGGKVMAKRRKRLRRAYLKKYPGTGPNKTVVAEYYKRATARSFSTEMPDTKIRPFQLSVVDESQAIPRVVTQEKMLQLRQSDFWQGVNEFHAKPLIAGITLYFHANDFFFRIVEKDGTIRRSIVYVGQRRAMRAFYSGRIAWDVVEARPTPASPTLPHLSG
jgi:hypothetical protein